MGAAAIPLTHHARNVPQLRHPARVATRMTSRSKGPRQSFITIGIRVTALHQHPRLTVGLVSTLLDPPGLRHIGRLFVGGK